MIKIEQELQLDHIFSYLKKNKDNKKEFNRYCKSIAKNIVSSKNDSFYGIIQYMLTNYFSCSQTFLNSLITEINNTNNNAFLVPVFGYSKNKKELSISKELFCHFDNINVFDKFLFKRDGLISDFLNLDDLLKSGTTSKSLIDINTKKIFCGFILISSNDYFDFEPQSINKKDYYLSINSPFKYSLSKIIDMERSFFNYEKINYFFDNAIKEINKDNALIDVEIMSSLNDVNILFYDKSMSTIHPINIIGYECRDYEELVDCIDFIDDLLKKKGIDYTIKQ